MVIVCFFLSFKLKTSESVFIPYFFSHQYAIYLYIQLALPSKSVLNMTLGAMSTASTTTAIWHLNFFHSGKHFCHYLKEARIVLKFINQVILLLCSKPLKGFPFLSEWNPHSFPQPSRQLHDLVACYFSGSLFFLYSGSHAGVPGPLHICHRLISLTCACFFSQASIQGRFIKNAFAGYPISYSTPKYPSSLITSSFFISLIFLPY